MIRDITEEKVNTIIVKDLSRYAGKVNFYLSSVDDLIKDERDNPSIGIILCREKDKFSVEYSLKDINKPINAKIDKK